MFGKSKVKKNPSTSSISTPNNLMGKSSSSDSHLAGRGTINIIGQGTEIEGEIISDNDIRVDGVLKGLVKSKSKVVIGSTGVIEGDVVCKNADITGKLTGKLSVSDLLFLKSSANVHGDIVTNKIVVESGAVMNGTLQMGDVKAQKMVENKLATSLKKEAV